MSKSNSLAESPKSVVDPLGCLPVDVEAVQRKVSDDLDWEYETTDPRSALIEKLRALPRDGGFIKAADLDAVLNVSIEAKKESE